MIMHSKRTTPLLIAALIATVVTVAAYLFLRTERPIASMDAQETAVYLLTKVYGTRDPMPIPLLFQENERDGTRYAYVFAQTAMEESHVATANIGAGVFRKIGGFWWPVFRSPNMAQYGAWGRVDSMKALRVGPGNDLFVISWGNMAQGIMFGHDVVLRFDGTRFVEVLSVNTKGDDGTNAKDCAPTRNSLAWEETSFLSARAGADADFADIIVDIGGTTLSHAKNGTCRVVEHKESQRYVWNGSTYQYVK